MHGRLCRFGLLFTYMAEAMLRRRGAAARASVMNSDWEQ